MSSAVAEQALRTGPLAAGGEHLVVVVAHPDDETFGCGSLIAQSAAAGARVTVLCATRGGEGERVPDPVTACWPLGLVREVELTRAARALGVDEVALLGYRDSGFDGDAHPRSLVATPVDVVARDLACRLAALEPDVVLTLDGSDGHRDHVHLRDAVALALGSVATEGRRPRLVHSSLANSLMRRWAEERAGADTVYLELDLDELGRPDAELVAIDTSAVLAVREEAIACHRSQASPYDGLSPELRRAFLTVDHVVEVPW
ncbi:PIG-L family deacetylase [Iamia sp. SCSIO 61187]|uniref:PIG-L deacetylase family protein n=1 Tax=Iamia sp. SCSIO 61187 TaxID=2722752 RepID=UPI001C632D3D|nr:PIG-L deacetylase family protein [Iamia sp. SCSIO 61187]QYG91936.1 PIG-L family deacetylase [Iamia sp. SCSIO 61187]